MRAFCGRFSLGFALCATLLGADCQVGRQVVDELPTERPGAVCGPKSCDFEHEPEFQLPIFAEAPPCPPETCLAVPLEGLTSESFAETARLSYAAETSTELTLSRVSLRDVTLELSGPVTLRVVGGSFLSNVFVNLSSAPGQGAPRLFVEESNVQKLTVRGASEGALAGRVDLVRDMVNALDVSSESTSIHSSVVLGARLESAQLELVDVTLATSLLSFDEGFLASVKASNLRTVRCGRLATALTSIGGEASEVGPCASLRLQSSSMTLGMLDGDVHLEDSDFLTVFVGKRAKTTLDSWNGSLERVRFCAQTGLLRLHQSTIMLCSSCEGAEALSACTMEGTPDVLRNPCEVLKQELPVCAEPWPLDTYPL